MKKISILTAALVLSIGICFGSVVSVTPQQKADKTAKPATKKTDKKTVKKVPAKKKPENSKDAKTTK